jgi:putative SOS response-associated peptidase YedK
MASIILNAAGGGELVLARWGMLGRCSTVARRSQHPQRVSHWRGRLSPKNRCVVPATAFCEYADGDIAKAGVSHILGAHLEKRLDVDDEQPSPLRD